MRGEYAPVRVADLLRIHPAGKEEHEGIESFLKGKKVRVKNKMNEDIVVPALGDDDDDEDDDMSDLTSGEEVRKPKAANDDDDSEDGELTFFTSNS